MAGKAGGSIGIAGLCRLPVNAFVQFLRFGRMTFRALCGLQLCRGSHLVNVSVAGRTRLLAQNGVNALCRVCHFLRVARFALCFRDLRRMWEILDGSMAIGACQSPMHTRGVLVWPDGNALAFFGLHVRLTVAGKAGFILPERQKRFFLVAS